MGYLARLSAVVTLLAAAVTVLIYFTGAPSLAELIDKIQHEGATTSQQGGYSSFSDGAGNGRTVVERFYHSLSIADADSAQLYVVPEKRGRGAYDPDGIKQYYSKMIVPLRVSNIASLGGDAFSVNYEYTLPSQISCSGHSTVYLVQRDNSFLIEKIVAPKDRCG